MLKGPCSGGYQFRPPPHPLNALHLSLKASEPLVTVNHAGSANIVGRGWFLFGGYNESLVNAQQLNNSDADWTLGPFLYGNYSDKEQCIVQVSFSKTLFDQDILFDEIYVSIDIGLRIYFRVKQLMKALVKWIFNERGNSWST